MEEVVTEIKDDSIIQDNWQKMRHIHAEKQGTMLHIKHWQNQMEMHRRMLKMHLLY